MYEEETQGQRLRRLREAIDLTQSQLAHQAGLSGQSAIGNVENGTRGLGKSVLAVAKVLGVSPEYLACQTDEQVAAAPFICCHRRPTDKRTHEGAEKHDCTSAALSN